MDIDHETPLDEIVWKSPQDLQELGSIHTNTILHYFSRSPFYDHTSNNATVITQALYNPNMLYTIETREAFEGRLRTMQGLEFMVTHDPSDNDTRQDHSGIWIIRKQMRRKRNGQADEVTPIKSYFVVGENVYVAPSVENVLSCRLLSTVTSLTKMLSIASSLPNFTPASGHAYLPAAPKNQTPSASFQMTQNSEASTALQSGSTPRGDSQETASKKSGTASRISGYDDVQSAQLLEASYELLLRYGNEYMDENPLIGEPGSFKLSKTKESGLGAVNTSQTSNQAFKAAATAKKAPPPKLQTDMSSEAAKKISAGSAKSPTTPGLKKKKERRKSKAAGAEEVTTPKSGTQQTAA